ncbi:phosphotransferase [Microbacterium azadirachtae]|uniref:phosphotransferase n=1 Tax=Microbacterium azadirachtae TaxID=582680 RepID=UPI0008897E9C|nr:phosphotransferase [Microbacterium azadirachtae]SDM27293.1 Predicted kinase, aminoglycoside phosphotransferase (APT) family [Microbacterium azadirachtae]SEG49416.1 Predicted kinase, aminoglycoside phosphotransferase (APT) family [Microbacterium azadirachtae]SEG50655.1 Predicted kinase, aminoglycoside phosphotransferase (APT) family [Microbacterium azadirachtae]
MDRHGAGRGVLTEDRSLSSSKGPGQLRVAEAAAAERIVAAFPAFAGLPVRALATPGTVNALFRIGDAHVARFPLQPTPHAEIAAEAAALEEFATVAPFPAPVPVGVVDGDAGYPSAWSVQTWIPGRTASEGEPDGSESTCPGLAEDLAHLIVALRAAPLRGRSFDGRGRGGDLRAHEDWMSECFARSAHLLDVGAARSLWARLSRIPHPGVEVMSHRDLTPPNLVLSDDGRLGGVLDGGSFGPADPALDLVVAWHVLDRRDGLALRAALGCGDAEWRRGAAWALQQAMGLGWYYERTNPVMAALGLRTMGRLLADPDLAG